MLALPIFFLSPVTCIFSLIVLGAFINKSFIFAKTQILLLPLFLGLLNSTKVLASDLEGYFERFFQAQNATFFEYITLQFGDWNREPIFKALTYILFHVSNGSWQFYLISISYLAYFPLFFAIYRYAKHFRLNPQYLMFAIILIGFFPFYFSLSAHLLRQIISMGLVTYIFVDKLIVGRTNILLLVLAILNHSSALLFIPFLFFDIFMKRFTVLNFIILLSVSTVFLSLARAIISSLLNFLLILLPSFLVYPLARLGSGSSFVELIGDTNLTVLYGISLAFWIFFLIKYSSSKDVPKPYLLLNSFAILNIFILLSSSDNLLQIRYIPYLIIIFPFIIPSLCNQNNIIRIMIFLGASLMMVVYFFYSLVNGVWDYGTISEIFSVNLFF